MYIDEELLFRGYGALDVNIIATRLLQMVGISQPDTPILGPVIVVGLPDREGYDTSVPLKLHSLVRLIEAGVRAQETR